MRLAWRVDALDDWREKVDVWRTETDDSLRAIVQTDRIAEAVSKRMSERHGVYLSRVQLVVAFFALFVPSIVTALVVKAIGG